MTPTANTHHIKAASASPERESALILGHIAESIRRSAERLGEHVCPICGKLFYPPSDEWVYRRAGNLLCSWSCVCTFDRAEKADREQKRARAKEARASRRKGQISPRDLDIVRARASGESSVSIAARYFISPDHVRRIVRRYAREHGNAGRSV